MRHIKDVCENIAKRLGVTLDASQKERFFLDRLVEKGKLSDSKLTCIASRPGTGKTILALDFVLPEAMETEKNILIFSSEKAAEQMVAQFIMKLSGINICLISSPFADPKKKVEFAKALSFLSGLNVYFEGFEEQKDLELSYIEKTVEGFEDVGLVLIDGLYCFLTIEKEEFGLKLQSEAIARIKVLSQRKNALAIITTYMSREDIKKAYNEDVLDNVFFGNGVDMLLVLHKSSVISAIPVSEDTELLLVNKSGNRVKEKLYYDTKYRRFLKLVD